MELNAGPEEISIKNDAEALKQFCSHQAAGEVCIPCVVALAQKVQGSTPGDMDCDRWAADFQEILEQAGVIFTPVMYLIRPGKKRSAQAQGAEIHFEGEKIGHDSHFVTIVESDGVDWVYDNLNPEGLEATTHRSKLSFHLMDMKKSTRYDTVLKNVDFGADVIIDTRRAKVIRQLRS